MMDIYRNFFLIYILFFSSLICYGQKQNMTELHLDQSSGINIKLSGQVKYVKVIKKNILSDTKEEIEYFFNSDGQPTKIIKKSLGIDLILQTFRDEVTVFSFNNGFLISELNEIESGLDGNIYELDDKNNTICKKFFLHNCLISDVIYEYDEFSRLIKSIEYAYGYSKYSDNQNKSKKSDYISMIETFTYDDLGRVIESTMDNRRGSVFKKKVYKYDSNGNQIEEGSCENYSGIDSFDSCAYYPLFGWDYNDKNQVIKKFQLAKFSPHNTDTYYKYDDRGNEIETKGYYINNDTVLGYHYIYEFDHYGNKTKEKQIVGKYGMFDFESYQTYTIKYNDFQNVILEEYIKVDGSTIKVIRNNYTYDKNSNWVERETEEGKSIDAMSKKEIVKRIIEYYN